MSSRQVELYVLFYALGVLVGMALCLSYAAGALQWSIPAKD